MKKKTGANFMRHLKVTFLLLTTAAGMVVESSLVGQTLSGYTNNTTVNTAPQIDATNFLNIGTWNIITTPYPFRTGHTLNYDNRGSMTGSIGWDFEWYPVAGGQGVAKPSATFTNENNGIITATDDPTYGSFLLVNATNITGNSGKLNAGAGGKIQFVGMNVNLARSQIQITPVVSTGGGYASGKATNFAGDVGVYDQAWGLGTNYFNPSINFQAPIYTNTVSGAQYTNLVESITTRAPEIIYNVDIPCGGTEGPFNTFFADYSTDNYLYSGTNSPAAGTNLITGYADWTNKFTRAIVPVLVPADNTGTNFTTNNVVSISNLVVQAVFVRVADTNFSAGIRFYPSTIVTNPAMTASVLLQASITNTATLQASLSTLCLVDTMLAETNTGLAANANANLVAGCSGTTFRPRNYTLSRTIQPQYTGGIAGLGTPTADLFSDASFITNIVNQLNKTNLLAVPILANTAYSIGGEPLLSQYTAYSAYIDNLASEPPATASLSLTNFPGEVRIYATNLDLTSSRIRAEGELLVKANHLTPSSTNASIDCQNLGFYLGATNGFLHFMNLAHTSVSRLNGELSACTTVWTNVITQVFNSGATNAQTNTIHVQYSVLLVDAKSLSTLVPVKVYDLILHATNVDISDQMNIVQGLYMDGTSFTLDSSGSLSLESDVSTFQYTNIPNMLYFTNNGTINVAYGANFGSDGPIMLNSFVNRGQILSDGQSITAKYAELDGTDDASSTGFFSLNCGFGSVSNAYLNAGIGMEFDATNLIISGSEIISGDTLNLRITNNLIDGGSALPNIFYCQNGFNLPVKPASGNLLGSTFDTVITGGAQVNHIWSGNDLGATAAGYVNNAAIGALTLTAQNLAVNPLFYFAGSGTHNALYVDQLDVSSLGSQYTNYLQLATNLVIYYNSATADASLTNTQTASQVLNGQLAGHLVWIGVAQQTNIIFSALPFVKNKGLPLTVGGVLFPSGVASSNVIIQGSTNLTSWINLFTNTPPFSYTNTDYTNYPYRFFRARQGW
jgi:hypothetical protein